MTAFDRNHMVTETKASDDLMTEGTDLAEMTEEVASDRTETMTKPLKDKYPGLSALPIIRGASIVTEAGTATIGTNALGATEVCTKHTNVIPSKIVSVDCRTDRVRKNPRGAELGTHLPPLRSANLQNLPMPIQISKLAPLLQDYMSRMRPISLLMALHMAYRLAIMGTLYVKRILTQKWHKLMNRRCRNS